MSRSYPNLDSASEANLEVCLLGNSRLVKLTRLTIVCVHIKLAAHTSVHTQRRGAGGRTHTALNSAALMSYKYTYKDYIRKQHV